MSAIIRRTGPRWEGCDSLAHVRDANERRRDAWEARRNAECVETARRIRAGQEIQERIARMPIPRHRALVPA